MENIYFMLCYVIYYNIYIIYILLVAKEIQKFIIYLFCSFEGVLLSCFYKQFHLEVSLVMRKSLLVDRKLSDFA